MLRMRFARDLLIAGLYACGVAAWRMPGIAAYQMRKRRRHRWPSPSAAPDLRSHEDVEVSWRMPHVHQAS
jgi:hypothetical protein